MSKYIRDDKQFREQVAKLAAAGLRLDRSIKTARETMIAPLEAHGFSKKDYPTNFNGVPAYMRTIEPLEIAPKGKLPEFIAGAIAATVVLLLVAGAAYLGWRIL
jgi:hypothetical protein